MKYKAQRYEDIACNLQQRRFELRQKDQTYWDYKERKYPCWRRGQLIEFINEKDYGRIPIHG